MKAYLLVLLLLSSNLSAAVSREEASILFDHFRNAYAGEQLVFNPPIPRSDLDNFDFDLIHASYNFFDDKHFINIFGGVIKLPKLTVDGLASIVCHEIGHGFGGEPRKLNGASSEGQSDYYVTALCLKKIFETYEIDHLATTEVLASCDGDHYCERASMAIINGIMTLIETTMSVKLTFFDRDLEKVTTLNRDDSYYPTPQCRMMTLRQGILNNERPACWFPQHERK